MRNKMCLTLSDAAKIVAACKAEATKNKWNITIAVVDDGGFLVQLERMDGAVAQSAFDRHLQGANFRRNANSHEGSGRNR